MGGIKSTDWIASLLIPGWTQVMCHAFPSAAFFFLVALYNHIVIGWAWGLFTHACAALHGWVLIREHIAGTRPATREAYEQRRKTNRGQR